MKLEPLHSNNNIPPTTDGETVPLDKSPLAMELQELFGERLKLDASIKRYTAAQVGGPVDGLIEINSLQELEQTVGILWQYQHPFLILGGGSNVLVSDAGVRAIVLINRARQVLSIRNHRCLARDHLSPVRGADDRPGYLHRQPDRGDEAAAA